MARIKCEVKEEPIYSEEARREIPGVCVTCGECDREVEVFGTTERSVKRGLTMLRDACTEGENFYVVDDG